MRTIIEPYFHLLPAAVRLNFNTISNRVDLVRDTPDQGQRLPRKLIRLKQRIG
jgi:hypothetical protein